MAPWQFSRSPLIHCIVWGGKLRKHGDSPSREIGWFSPWAYCILISWLFSAYPCIRSAIRWQKKIYKFVVPLNVYVFSKTEHHVICGSSLPATDLCASRSPLPPAACRLPPAHKIAMKFRRSDQALIKKKIKWLLNRGIWNLVVQIKN